MRRILSPIKIIAVLMYFAGAFCLWEITRKIDASFYSTAILPIYLSVGGIALVVLWRHPFGKRAVEAGLLSIGFVNHLDETPKLVRKYCDARHPHMTVFEFKNPGIPLTTWETKQPALEAGLNKTILRMNYHRGKRRVQVYAVSAQNDVPTKLLWQDKYLSCEEFTLVLGESLLGPVTIDLAHIPHVLVGGASGSGKSVLLKLLLMQSLKKGAEVYIADFKGGVDFPPAWHERCRMCFEEEDLLTLLTELVGELERRKMLFRNAECPDIVEYNKATGQALKRYIFACDEVAEVLDKTGRSKEQKELLSQIESKLSIIARQGRAFGIHLILATQRPDANLIPGQLRTNLGCRICGRADSILSQIILDDTTAAEQIPKDARGRFILHDGTLFQSYWFDEQCI